MADSPLIDKDLKDINDNLLRLNIADEAIRKAEQAGIDVAEFKSIAREQRTQLLKIKQTYFPGQA